MTCDKCGGQIVNGFCSGCGDEFMLGARGKKYESFFSGKYYESFYTYNTARDGLSSIPGIILSGGCRVTRKPTSE